MPWRYTSNALQWSDINFSPLYRSKSTQGMALLHSEFKWYHCFKITQELWGQNASVCVLVQVSICVLYMPALLVFPFLGCFPCTFKRLRQSWSLISADQQQEARAPKVGQSHVLISLRFVRTDCATLTAWEDRTLKKYVSTLRLGSSQNTLQG